MKRDFNLAVEEIRLGNPRLKDFVKFPWRLYHRDHCWTPPLNGDLLGNRLLGLDGLLTSKHPYHSHSEVTHFLAYRSKQVVGRISAAINHKYNQYYNSSIGFFGFFEVIDDYKVAETLLDHAREWVTHRGMKTLRGPGEYSNATHERQGILIEGFEYPPTVELTHNPPYYGRFIERYGFKRAKDYLAFKFDRKTANIGLVQRLAKKVSKEFNHIETRPLVFSKLREEVGLILDIYNEAWSRNWGFLPISNEEGDAIANTLQFIIDPGLVRFAFIDGKPVAVMGVIPDPNYALRPRWRWYGESDLVRVIRLLTMRRRIPVTRGMFFGVKSEFRNTGLPVVLAGELASYILPRHYQVWDASLILEDNSAIIKIIDTFGGQYYKRWRIYDLPL